jgi:hypothetical protein
MPKNSLNGIHAQRLKEIRQFINFDYDLRKPLSKFQKSRILEYYKEIKALEMRPHIVYRPRRKDRLATAQEFAQHEKRLPGLKVAFIPTNGDEIPHIRFNKKKQLVSETRHVRTEHLKLNTKRLVKNPIEHVESVIKKAPRAKRFTILAGRYEIPGSYSREKIAQGVAYYTGRYDDKSSNHYFGRWLHGISAHHFKNQAEFSEYQNAKSKNKAKLKREARARKAKAERQRRKLLNDK